MNLHMLNIKRRDAEIERLLDILEIQEDALKEFHAEIERLRAVVDAVDYLYECWRESGDSVDWGNALPNLFEKRAALEDNNE